MIRSCPPHLRPFLLLLLVAALAGSARAQVANNTMLVGTVHDPSGSVIPNSQVKATNVETGVIYNGVTNAHGDYSIQFIVPGPYSITVTDPGFQQITKTNIIVTVDQAARTDFDLTVGSETQSITISALTPPIDTDDANLGETFDAKSVVDLPLLGHNALDVAATASNVTIGGNSSYSGVPPGEDFIGAGQREIQNSLSLDGVSIMNNLLSAAPARPSSDMISEVQMQSGNYSAQYGSYLGLHINMVTKSGTNDLHGAVYDYVQNTALNARPFGSNISQPVPIVHYNQYGFDLGGPVYLPKLYNGRDKTFFFGSWGRLKSATSGPATTTTLTPAERNGDFSAVGTFDANGNCISGNCIIDPTTGLPYPGNIIPAAQLATPAALIAKNIENYMLLPNLPGSDNGTVNNLQETPAQSLVITQTLDRVDENIGEHVRLFFRYHFQNINAFTGSIYPTNTSSGPTQSRNYALGYTHLITQNLVNDFRIGLNTITTNNLNYFAANNIVGAGTALGIPGFTSDTLYNSPGIPNFNIDSYEPLGNDSSNWYQDDRTIDGYDQISYTRGKHNLMAGVEIRKLTIGREAANDDRGVFDFYSGNTDPSQGAITSTGYGAADFVLGVAQDDTTPILPTKGSIAEFRDGFFLLDNWKPFERLTLNYGVRYELPTVPYSLNGYTRILNANETALIPDTTATVAADFKPVPGFKFINPTHLDIAPRFGFAFRPSNTATLRGGFGIYYNANQLNTYTLTTQNYPLSSSVQYFPTNSQLLTLSSPTPGDASGNPTAGTPGTYVSAITMGPNLPTQRLYQWNLSAGQELWTGAAFELQYLGSHGLHLDRNFYDNTPAPGAGDINARRPNQLFGRIRRIQNDAYSHYDALTAIYRQRSYHGLSALLSYTWAHDRDITDDSNGTGNTQDNYNISADYGDSGWDIRHRFVGSALYALPKLDGHNALVRQTLGGWQANTIVTLQTGGPLNVTLDFDQANVSQPRNNVQRPNQIAPLHIMHCTTQNYIRATPCFDASAFAVPAFGTFGNAHRDLTHGPGSENIAFSLFKNFPIYERIQLQFRAEANNLLNHPSIGSPATDLNAQNFNPNDPQTIQGFGLVTGAQSPPRVLQLAAKVNF